MNESGSKLGNAEHYDIPKQNRSPRLVFPHRRQSGLTRSDARARTRLIGRTEFNAYTRRLPYTYTRVPIARALGIHGVYTPPTRPSHLFMPPARSRATPWDGQGGSLDLLHCGPDPREAPSSSSRGRRKEKQRAKLKRRKQQEITAPRPTPRKGPSKTLFFSSCLPPSVRVADGRVGRSSLIIPLSGSTRSDSLGCFRPPLCVRPPPPPLCFFLDCKEEEAGVGAARLVQAAPGVLSACSLSDR